MWAYPDTWLEGDHQIDLGPRTLDAVHTPGHTPGHFVFADQRAGLLFAGDHVLPTITPSIGFTMPPTPLPLADFLGSLAKVRALPDLEILPAHGPVAPRPTSASRSCSSTTTSASRSASRPSPRVRARPGRSPACCRGPVTSGTTTSLDIFSQGMAAMETKAHLELLVARGQASRTVDTEGVVTFAVVPSRIGTCGIPSSRYSGPSTSKPRLAYQSASGAWASEDDVAAGADRERGVHEDVGETLAAGGPVEHDAADPPHVAVVEDPRIAEDLAASSRITCRVPGSGSRPSRSP